VLYDQHVICVISELDLPHAVHVYRETSQQLSGVLGARNYTVYTDFVFSTLMAHFRLYQYVFTKDRNQQTPGLGLKVGVTVMSWLVVGL
jgi:hypothetical protein